jgi:hypothetical protein
LAPSPVFCFLRKKQITAERSQRRYEIKAAPGLRDRRICFIFGVSKQQILRCAQDDTLEEEFFNSLLNP